MNLIAGLILASMGIQTGPTLPAGTLMSLPFSRGELIFTTRSTGHGGAVFCVQHGPGGKPKVLLNSKDDANLALYPLDDFVVSDDNRYLAHFVPQPGKLAAGRYEVIRIFDMKTGKPLPDEIPWTYSSDFTWLGKGFFYGRYPKPSHPEALKAPHSNERVFYHLLGTPTTKDKLFYEDPVHPLRKYLYLTTFDHHWFLLHALERIGEKRTSSEWLRQLSPGAKFIPIQPIQAEGRFFLIDDYQGQLMYHTTYKSPKGRVILVDPRHPDEKNWQTVIPEKEASLTDAEPVAGKIAVVYTTPQGGSKGSLYSMSGKFEREIPSPPEATVDIQWGRPQERYIFLSIKKPKEPLAYFRYDLDTREVIPFK